MTHVAVEIQAVSRLQQQRLIEFRNEAQIARQHMEIFLALMTRQAPGCRDAADRHDIDRRMHFLVG